MAIQQVWVGSIGPLQYNDDETYPDSVPRQGIRATQMYIEDAPSDGNNVVRQSDMPVFPVIEQTEASFPVNCVFVEVSNVNPADILGFGIWLLIHTIDTGTDHIYFWKRVAMPT